MPSKLKRVSKKSIKKISRKKRNTKKNSSKNLKKKKQSGGSLASGDATKYRALMSDNIENIKMYLNTDFKEYFESLSEPNKNILYNYIISTSDYQTLKSNLNTIINDYLKTVNLNVKNISSKPSFNIVLFSDKIKELNDNKNKDILDKINVAFKLYTISQKAVINELIKQYKQGKMPKV